MTESLSKDIPFTISVIVTQQRNQPCVELRRVTTDTEIIKSIISCAFHDRPIIVLPTFYNKMQSINSLLEKGIIYKDKENKQLYFTF